MEDLTLRKRFTRKVFTLLSLELAFLTAVIWPFVYLEEFQLFLTTEFWLHSIIFIGSLLMIATIVLSVPNYSRRIPYSYILLQTLVTSIGVVMGTFSMMFNTTIILICTIQTLGLVLLLTAFSYFHPGEITTYKNIVLLSCLMFLIALFSSSISLIILKEIIPSLLSLLISTIVVILLCPYFLYDARLILNGKRLNINYEDHDLAVIHLLLDVGFMFMFLLRGKDEPMFGLVT